MHSAANAFATSPDGELISAAARGDREAFACLYASHRAAVSSRLAQLHGRRVELDDLVQETFLRAWRSLARFRGECPFRMWLLRIATFTAREHQRSSRRSIWRLFIASAEEDAHPVVVRATAESYPDLVVMHAALALLSARLREAVILFELQGHTLEEIAGELGVPVHTVAARVRRGRAALRRRLAKLGYDDAASGALPTRPHPLRLAGTLVLALLLLVSGASAWIHGVRAHRPTAAPAAREGFLDQAPHRSPAAATPKPAAVVVPKRRHLRSRRIGPVPATAPKPAETTAIDFVEPSGEVVFARPPLPREPLFSVAEYRSRGVLVTGD